MNRIRTVTVLFSMLLGGAGWFSPTASMAAATCPPGGGVIGVKTSWEVPGKRLCHDQTRCFSRTLPECVGVLRLNSRPDRVITIADRSGSGMIRPSEIYHTAYQDYLQGRFQLAIDQFEKFVEDFPTSSLAPQAYYYLGECYQNVGNLTRAAQNFSLIITRHKERVPYYQNSRQIPPALFRLGGVYEEVGKLEKARAFWGILLTDFPGTPEAQLAKKRLQRLP